MGSFECEKCGAMFDNADDLAEHMREEHGSNSESYECSDCGEVFSSKTELEMHIKEAHSDSESESESD